MIPNTVIIALTITLLALLKDYFINDKHLNIPIYMGVLLSWGAVLFDNIPYYCIGGAIFVIVSWACIASTIKKDAVINNDVQKPTQLDETINIFNGIEGVVNAIMPDGSYLGTIFYDNKVQEIIVYSTEIMEKGDKFTILGIFSGKIMANKKIN